MRQLSRFILDTLFPPQCVSCKREGDFLCKNCVQGFKKKRIRPISFHSPVKPREFQYLDGVIYALNYAKNPQIKAAIEQFKYKFNRDLSEYFGDLIAEKLGELTMAKNRPLQLIPVPLHRKRLYYRGFNQAEVIAKSIVKRMGPYKTQIAPVLERTRHTKQQAKSNPWLRRHHLKGAFRLSKKFVQEAPSSGWLCFLVDDVCTTGSTLENCAKVLKENGWGKVYGLVVARAFK
ncbi:MAG: hypothetical protein V1760_02650 [Candidatus Peregrinibacteria bacterium]